MKHETVFSWVARYHCKVGAGHFRNTYQALFNQDKIRLHPYLPGALKKLDGRADKTSLNWIREHTLYPLFRFFGSDEKDRLKEAMLCDASKVISRAGLPRSKVSFPVGHRFCPICCFQAKESNGFSYFDIRFQIPGVQCCPFHQCELKLIPSHDFGIDRQLVLPREFNASVLNEQLKVEFSQFCFDVFDKISTGSKTRLFDIAFYRHYLQERGYITKSGQVRLNLLLNNIQEFYQGFEFNHGLESLASFNYLGALLRQKSYCVTRPVKHLLLSFWLFNKEPIRYFETNISSSVSKKSLKAVDDFDDSVIVSLLKQHTSIAEITRQTGKSHCYIYRIAGLHSLNHSSPKSYIDKTTHHRLMTLALLGRHRQYISKLLKLNIGTVELAISAVPNLVEWRKKLNFIRKENAAILELTAARKLHPDWIRQQLKLAYNKAFFFLYRHNRDLLNKILPKKTLPSSYSGLNWQEEDERLFDLINQIENPSLLPVGKIGLLINDRSHLKNSINKLPKTKNLLMEFGVIEPKT